MPVMDAKKQKDTIVVSVIDETFSADGPEHVKIANAIEIRLDEFVNGNDRLPHKGLPI
jgi:Immunity protein 52